MFCWNCGKEMDDDLLFCPHCAMKQAGIPEPKPKRKVPVRPLVYIIICTVILIASLTGILILASGEKTVSRPVDPYSVELPDLAAFLNTRYTRDDVSTYTHYVVCTLDGSNSREAVQAYVELLQEDCWQLALDDSWDSMAGSAKCTDYIFRYTGRGTGIGWVYHTDGYKYHAKLSVNEHTSGSTVITFYTHPGFELADPGVEFKN